MRLMTIIAQIRVLALMLFLGAYPALAEPTFDIVAEFEAQLINRGVEFVARDDGRYDILSESGKITIALDNLHRSYATDKDETAISRFIDNILFTPHAMPDWRDARENVFPMMETAEIDVGDKLISKRLSKRVELFPVYYNEGSGTLRYLSESDALNWGVSEVELWDAADARINEIMQSTNVTYIDAGELKLGVIEAPEPYKASLIRAPSLRAKVEEKLGWPVYAMVPSRGFVFLMSKSDEPALGSVGPTIVKEYMSARHPISTDVWELSDAGIQSIGAFPTE